MDLLWSASNGMFFGPSQVFHLADRSSPNTSNCQKFLFLFAAGRSLSPATIVSSLRIRAESDIAILRFGRKTLRVEYTSREDSAYVEVVFPINGVFNVSFSWFGLPLFDCQLEISQIDFFVGSQSMMNCYGGRYLNRWCVAWNVCWKWKRFYFYGDIATFFKVRIAYPGSRPPPNDYLSCRIIFRMIAAASFPSSDLVETWYNETSFLTCRWNGMQHFWHLLMDFTVPLWWAMRLHNATDRHARIFTLDNNTGHKGYLFCPALSEQSVENIRNMSRTKYSCWKHAIIGVPKSEKFVQPEKWPNGYDMPYEYPHEAVAGMREHFLGFYNPGESTQSVLRRCQPNAATPRVVFAFRVSEKRHIVNKVELIEAIKEWCPECVVDQFYGTGETANGQLNFVCNASILIGIHGGGLTHMLFQKPSAPDAPTAVIEILPYGYTCRNWYKFAAITANVRYFRWANPYLNNSLPVRGSKNSPCFTQHELCMSDQCHDLLRDQLTTVDLDDFRQLFLRTLAYVKGESPFNEIDLANQTDETATFR
jgi:hypothetical protein